MALIFLITALLGGFVSYVRAAYIEPLSAPGLNNAPSPILTGDVPSSGSGTFPVGQKGFFKIGKIGITNNKDNNAVDQNQFTNNTMVVMGQTSAESFTSAYSNRIRAELSSNSQLFALYVGNPALGTFLQRNSDSSPINFIVKDHTRAPRIVIGSKTAPGNAYNLYLAEGSNATNLGKSLDSSTYSGGPGGQDYTINNKTSFCTLTETQLKNSGCPAMTYMGQIFPDPNTGTSGDVVASCHQTTPQSVSYPYGNFNKGSCY